MATDRFAKSVLCLAGFVVVNTAALIMVSVFQFYNISGLDIADTDLQSDLDGLLLRLQQNGDHITDISLVLKRSLQDTKHKRAGLQDIFLDILKAQEQVIERHCHDTGVVCQPGLKGDEGRPGLTGETGNNGNTGLKGTVGIPGLTGAKGVQGPTGEVGLVGDKGVKGSQGSAGPIGDKGYRGEQGIRGPKGAPGTTGNHGNKGKTGPPGKRGPTGLKGELGVTGLHGESGLHGVKGIKGDPGERGHDVDKLKPGCSCWTRPKIVVPEREVRKVVKAGINNIELYSRWRSATGSQLDGNTQ